MGYRLGGGRAPALGRPGSIRIAAAAVISSLTVAAATAFRFAGSRPWSLQPPSGWLPVAPARPPFAGQAISPSHVRLRSRQAPRAPWRDRQAATPRSLPAVPARPPSPDTACARSRPQQTRKSATVRSGKPPPTAGSPDLTALSDQIPIDWVNPPIVADLVDFVVLPFSDISIPPRGVGRGSIL
jgi:hypothetical protein